MHINLEFRQNCTFQTYLLLFHWTNDSLSKNSYLFFYQFYILFFISLNFFKSVLNRFAPCCSIFRLLSRLYLLSSTLVHQLMVIIIWLACITQFNYQVSAMQQLSFVTFFLDTKYLNLSHRVCVDELQTQSNEFDIDSDLLVSTVVNYLLFA